MTDTLRLLVIDDSETDCKLIVRSLRGTFPNIVSERIETEAAMRAALRAEPAWDIILCDWAMPQFSGPLALSIRRELAVQIPFIIVSGTAGEEIAADAMRAGASDYVVKDRLSRLAPAVERELREQRALRDLQRAEQIVRAQQSRLQRLLDGYIIGVVGIDATNGSVLDINDTLLELLGWSRAELDASDRRWTTLTGLPEILPSKARAELAVSGRCVPFEEELRRRDGTPVAALIGAIKEEGSTLTAFVLDVSARTAAEREMRTQQRQFKTLFESGVVGIVIADLNGQILEANQAFLDIYGYSRDELTAGTMQWDRMLAPESLSQALSAVNQLLSTRVLRPLELDVLRRDGTRIAISVSATMLDSSKLLGFVTDITERRRDEAALLERANLAALMADVAVALGAAEKLDDSLERCANALVERIGATGAQIWIYNRTQKVLELRASAGGPFGDELDRITLEALTSERAGALPLLVEGEQVGALAVLSLRPLEATTQRALVAVADVIALGIRRKMVERSRSELEAQFLQAQKMEAVGILAGGVAHDFNNLLFVILSYSDMLMQDLAANDPMRDSLSEIKEAGDRAAALTRQLLAFSRQQVIDMRTLDLNHVIDNLQRMLKRLLGEDIELITVLGNGLGGCRGDAGQIEQVILNLAVNARDAMPSGGKLTIATENVELDSAFAASHLGVTAGPHIVLSIGDTGIGMDSGTLARIFEPFFTTKEKGRGTGLGLSTVFGIVEQSGGTIWVDSEPGRGTTFRIYFPRTDLSLLSDDVDHAVRRYRGSETILLVEDESQIRHVSKTILRREGYNVIEAATPGDALLAAEQYAGKIDLLLTDVVMPHMNGRDLAARIAKMRPGLRVLFMSGYTDGVLVTELAQGAQFLQKPLTPVVLAKKVRDLLDQVDEEA